MTITILPASDREGIVCGLFEKERRMGKKIIVFLVLFSIVPFLSVYAAAKAEEPARGSWEMKISREKKLTPEEEERERWVGVFANDIGIYMFDCKSLAMVENEKNSVNVLVRTIFTNSKVVTQLNEQYKAKLNADDKVGFSEMLMTFKVDKRKYVVKETKVCSAQGVLLEEIKAKEAVFKEVLVKTFADSMYEVAKAFSRNQ